jgi:hypothetical protein
MQWSDDTGYRLAVLSILSGNTIRKLSSTEIYSPFPPKLIFESLSFSFPSEVLE